VPPIQVFEALDGVFVIVDGVTRATRIAKMLPGTLVTVEVVGHQRRPQSTKPTAGDRLP
jgi:hypothetical protein